MTGRSYTCLAQCEGDKQRECHQSAWKRKLSYWMQQWMTLHLMSEQRNLQDSSWSTVHPEERSRERHTINECVHHNTLQYLLKYWHFLQPSTSNLLYFRGHFWTSGLELQSLSLNYWLSDVIIIVMIVNRWLVQVVELPHWLLLSSSTDMNIKLSPRWISATAY